MAAVSCIPRLRCWVESSRRRQGGRLREVELIGGLQDGISGKIRTAIMLREVVKLVTKQYSPLCETPRPEFESLAPSL